MPYDEDFKDAPLAYFISFRTFGTWLHGDRRGSVDRFHNIYGTPRLGPERARERYERSIMTRPPVRLNAKQRAAAERGLKRLVNFASGLSGRSMLELITFTLLRRRTAAQSGRGQC
jgi:hypothetical protein